MLGECACVNLEHFIRGGSFVKNQCFHSSRRSVRSTLHCELHWHGSFSRLLLSVQGHLANVYVYDDANRVFAQLHFSPHETCSDLIFLERQKHHFDFP